MLAGMLRFLSVSHLQARSNPGLPFPHTQSYCGEVAVRVPAWLIGIPSQAAEQEQARRCSAGQGHTKSSAASVPEY